MGRMNRFRNFDDSDDNLGFCDYCKEEHYDPNSRSCQKSKGKKTENVVDGFSKQNYKECFELDND